MSKDRAILKILKEDKSISLRKFLMYYCGINNKTLLSNKITHKDLKFLLPELKRVSFDYVLKNIDEVYTGIVVLVEDSTGNYAPYINPKIEEYIEEFDMDLEEDKIFESIVDLENLNLYALAELAKKYKSDNRIKEYRKVVRMIKKKKESDLETYHKNKEKIIIKERFENDEY